MSGDEKRVAPDELRRWAADLTYTADLLDAKGQECDPGVDAGAVTAEVLRRAAGMLEGVEELVSRLRATSDTLTALSVNYDLSEEANAQTLGFVLGWTENSGPPPSVGDY